MRAPAISLGEVCDIVSGATPKTETARFWGGSIPWATPKDLSSLESPYLEKPSRAITEDGLKSCSVQVLPANSVLLSSRAPIGLVAINTVPMATNQGFKSLIPSRGRLDSKFLYYWLKSKTEYLQSLGNGATFKEISKAIVERIEIPLPPFDEQRRIAAILDKADALRRKRKRALDLLEGLTQAIFLEMFGDPFELQDVLSHGAKESVPLSKVTSRITYGFTQPVSHHDTGIPILTAKNVRMGSLDIENVHFASEEEFEQLSAKSKPDPGDLLVTKDGTIGRVALFDNDLPVCMNQSVALVKPDRALISPVYLLHYILSAPVQLRIEGMKKGNAMPHLQITEFARFPIAMAPMDKQQKFERHVAAVALQRSRYQRSLTNLDAAFSSLQHRAFTGQL